MRLIDQLATWWLRRRGHQVGVSMGVTLAGNCVALSQSGGDIMLVINPCGIVNTFYGSSYIVQDEDFAAALWQLTRRK